ncbi:MAG: hypothetical protein HQM04_16935, partial [Magnetococcales bacterium]|nr:hypothetical protein [Magnetococcales bacterium]
MDVIFAAGQVEFPVIRHSYGAIFQVSPLVAAGKGDNIALPNDAGGPLADRVAAAIDKERIVDADADLALHAID